MPGLGSEWCGALAQCGQRTASLPSSAPRDDETSGIQDRSADDVIGCFLDLPASDVAATTIMKPTAERMPATGAL